MDAHQHRAVPGRRHGHFRHTLLLLGADGPLGRDLFLRLLYGAQTSLEVAVFATLGSVGLGVFMGSSPATSAAGSTPSSRG